MRLSFPVAIHQDGDGVYIAVCPVLQGCHSYGHTLDEALTNIREAIEAHIEARRLVGDPLPRLEVVEVEVP
jgi:predicted RNase H-like HicB family nuclease